MDVIVGGGPVTVIVADPEMFVYPACVEVAVQVPAPVLDGVNTPAPVIVPPVAVHVTVVLNAPVPRTLALHVEVCAVVIDEGVAVTDTEVIVGGGPVTVIVADPKMLVYPTCVEVAVIVAVPEALGVNTPPEVIAPSVADQVTALLKVPVPVTEAEQVEVCDVRIDAGEQETATDVTVGLSCEPPPPPMQPLVAAAVKTRETQATNEHQFGCAITRRREDLWLMGSFPITG
jgi:hypothetical protein